METKPYVLLVSFDAFRNDYVERYDAQNFKKFIENGITAKSLISTFPSKTFANHYAIATGMHAANNGLVDNSFFAPDLDTSYITSNRDLVENPSFYGGLPLWQLVQKNGMKAASYFWVGSETEIAGSYPTYWKKYDGSVSNEQRIDTVMHWLQLPEEKRPHLITLYFSFTDDVGHRYGPVSEEMQEAVSKADHLLGLIMDDLKKINLDVNVIVVSDHGMIGIEPKPENYLLEEELMSGLDSEKIRSTVSGTHVRFYCKDSMYKDELFQKLKSKENHFKIYKREETPESWNSRNNPRVGDIILEMEPGHYVVSEKTKNEILAKDSLIGVHGYDPTIIDMQGIFYASGPQIVKGEKMESFENVNVYPFVAELLGIKNYPDIDGDKSVLENYIQK